MTVAELRELLDGWDDDLEVRLVTELGRPMMLERTVRGLVTPGDLAMSRDLGGWPPVRDEGEEPDVPAVWLVEGSPVGRPPGIVERTVQRIHVHLGDGGAQTFGDWLRLLGWKGAVFIIVLIVLLWYVKDCR